MELPHSFVQSELEDGVDTSLRQLAEFVAGARAGGGGAQVRPVARTHHHPTPPRSTSSLDPAPTGTQATHTRKQSCPSQVDEGALLEAVEQLEEYEKVRALHEGRIEDLVSARSPRAEHGLPPRVNGPNHLGLLWLDRRPPIGC